MPPPTVPPRILRRAHPRHAPAQLCCAACTAFSRATFQAYACAAKASDDAPHDHAARQDATLARAGGSFMWNDEAGSFAFADDQDAKLDKVPCATSHRLGTRCLRADAGFNK